MFPPNFTWLLVGSLVYDYRKPSLYSVKSYSISCCFPGIAVVSNLYLNKLKVTAFTSLSFECLCL